MRVGRQVMHLCKYYRAMPRWAQSNPARGVRVGWVIACCISAGGEERSSCLAAGMAAHNSTSRDENTVS